MTEAGQMLRAQPGLLEVLHEYYLPLLFINQAMLAIVTQQFTKG